MIDNVILLITGTLRQRPIDELVLKCHPLGNFEQMEAVSIAPNPAELFNAILVDTPLGMSLNLFIDFLSMFPWKRTFPTTSSSFKKTCGPSK